MYVGLGLNVIHDPQTAPPSVQGFPSFDAVAACACFCTRTALGGRIVLRALGNKQARCGYSKQGEVSSPARLDVTLNVQQFKGPHTLNSRVSVA